MQTVEAHLPVVDDNLIEGQEDLVLDIGSKEIKAVIYDNDFDELTVDSSEYDCEDGYLNYRIITKSKDSEASIFVGIKSREFVAR